MAAIILGNTQKLHSEVPLRSLLSSCVPPCIISYRGCLLSHIIINNTSIHSQNCPNLSNDIYGHPICITFSTSPSLRPHPSTTRPPNKRGSFVPFFEQFSLSLGPFFQIPTLISIPLERLSQKFPPA